MRTLNLKVKGLIKPIGTYKHKKILFFAIKFTLETALLFLMSSVKEFGGALSLAFFTGLIYGGENIFIIAPIFMVANVAFNPSLWTLLYTVTPFLIYAVAYAIFFKIRKNMPMFILALCALISTIPYSVINALDGKIYEVIISVVITLVFSVCCQNGCYAVLIRGIKCRFAYDEVICILLMIAVCGYSLCGAWAFGFPFVFLFFAVGLFAVAETGGKAETFIFAISVGLGVAVFYRELSFFGVILLLGGVVALLYSVNRFVAFFGTVGALAMCVFLGLFPSACWQAIVTWAVGSLGFCALPKKLRKMLPEKYSGKENYSATSIINKNREETASRLFAVSDVFYGMSKKFENDDQVGIFCDSKKLAQEVSKNYCGRCSNRESCFAQLGGSTEDILQPLADAVITRGKATILDTPTFVSGRCIKTHNLLSVINTAGENYRKRVEQAQGIEIGKQMMSEQFAGMALILDSLARECGEHISLGDDNSDYIKQEFLKHNIVADDIFVTGSGSDVEVIVTVREADAEKLIIPRLISGYARLKMEVVKTVTRKDKKVLYLKGAPHFEIAYGVSEKIRGGANVSGDSKSILCPSRQRRMFAISDGMGSGELASKLSKDTISTVESFYRAGFDDALIMSLTNKLLKLNCEDGFSSLDISVIDTMSGSTDVLKLGAADSFVIRRDCIETLSSSALPIGAVDKISLETSKVQLYDGDMLVMMSDGVEDALDTKGVIDTIEELSTVNPQLLADELLVRALDKGATDDCTVMALRLVAQ